LGTPPLLRRKASDPVFDSSRRKTTYAKGDARPVDVSLAIDFHSCSELETSIHPAIFYLRSRDKSVRRSPYTMKSSKSLPLPIEHKTHSLNQSIETIYLQEHLSMFTFHLLGTGQTGT
jgi:hypothetical protein